jgi:hypothetical protein
MIPTAADRLSVLFLFITVLRTTNRAWLPRILARLDASHGRTVALPVLFVCVADLIVSFTDCMLEMSVATQTFSFRSGYVQRVTHSSTHVAAVSRSLVDGNGAHPAPPISSAEGALFVDFILTFYIRISIGMIPLYDRHVIRV